MAADNFTTQPIKGGIGPVHVNRFRVAFRLPHPALAEQVAHDFVTALPDFMDAHSATTEQDRLYKYHGKPTLCFHGVPLIRLFDLPFIPVVGPGGSVVTVPVPDKLRHLTLPKVHVDYVGVVDPLPGSPDRTGDAPLGITVQTLNRHFWRKEDDEVRRMVGDAIDMAALAALIASPLLAGVAITLEALKGQLIDYAVTVNRFHFLAGRRSFRLDRAARFHHRGPDDLWVFETAAVERYARPEFQLVTETLLGGDKLALGTIWRQMCALLGQRFNGPDRIDPAHTREGAGYWTAGGNILVVQEDLPSIDQVPGWLAKVSRYHPVLV